MDEDVVRTDLQKQFMKLEQIDDDKHLRQLQNEFLPDGDLHEGTTNRGFRLKLREIVDMNVSGMEDGQGEDDTGEDDNVVTTRSQLLKWKLEQVLLICLS